MATTPKAVATKGAVGKTVRWAAHLYHRWVRLAPEDAVALDSVLATLIVTRYDVEACLCPGDRSQRIRDALRTLHEAGEKRSTCHAVVLMLVAEVDLLEHDRAVMTTFIEAMRAELTTLDVPAEHAFGKGPHACPERFCKIYLPSKKILGLLLRS